MMGFNELTPNEEKLVDTVRNFSNGLEVFLEELKDMEDIDKQKLKTAYTQLDKGLRALNNSITNGKRMFLLGS